MKINIALPTRGLIFERTLKSLRDNDLSLDNLYIVSGLSIPQGHNQAVEKALETECDYILLLEDDMEFPAGTVTKMIAVGKDIVYADYPIDSGASTICTVKGEIYWGGLGCTLVKREVFEKLEKPYFTTDHSWLIGKKFTLTKSNNPSKYGGHDINFGMQVRERGFSLGKISEEVSHLRCNSLHRTQNNAGFFEINSLPVITKHQIH